MNSSPPCSQRQVPVQHYNSANYDELHRWVSYWHQIQSVARSQARTLLEIGVGSGVLSNYLRTRLHLDVTTVDFDPSLNPDRLGDVRNLESITLPDEFDAVVAFQVLEHLPFADFLPSLHQLGRASRRSVILSLPHYGYFLQLRWRLWKFSGAFGRIVSKNPRWSFDGEHHWEIGTRGHSLSQVRQTIQQALNIRREYFCPDHPYHYFFECEKS